VFSGRRFDERGIDVPDQFEQIERIGSHRLDHGLVQTNDDRELDQRRQTRCKRADLPFLVELHLFLAKFFLVALVFFLDLNEFLVFLQFLQRLGAFDLFHCQRVKQNPRDDSKQDDGYAKVSHQRVDPEQEIDKRSDDQRIPHGQ
jgi:hypothetical protein